MKAIATYIADMLVTFLQHGVIVGVYYLMNDFKFPELPSLAFGVAFLALFNTVENARKIRQIVEKRGEKPTQKFSTSVDL